MSGLLDLPLRSGDVNAAAARVMSCGFFRRTRHIYIYSVPRTYLYIIIYMTIVIIFYKYLHDSTAAVSWRWAGSRVVRTTMSQLYIYIYYINTRNNMYLQVHAVTEGETIYARLASQTAPALLYYRYIFIFYIYITC